MKFTKEIGQILFDGYYKGKVESGKKRASQTGKPVDFDKAVSEFPYIFGKIKKDIILTDYDDPELFKVRVKIARALGQNCVAIKSQNRGGHIYWMNKQRQIITSNNHNKTFLTLYPVDYKCGVKLIRSTGEIKEADNVGCISMEDKSLREVVYFQTNEDGGLDELPFYDCAIDTSARKENLKIKTEFLNLGEGTGRQESLFNYMIPVKTAKKTYEEFRQIAMIIDRFIFKESLGAEFENAIREDAWENVSTGETEWWDDKKFRHDLFADYIKTKYHIKKINGRIHVYDNGVFVPGYEKIEQIIYSEIPSLTRTKRNEVLDVLRISCEDEEPASANLIAFNNGIYHLDTNELTPLTPTENITNKIPWNYNDRAKSPLVDSVLDKLSCGDQETRHLLEEVAGSCLYQQSYNLEGGKCAILVGEKENGKSTYIHMLERMLGRENYSSLDFADLGDRFSTIMLYGKLANLGDDISSRFRDDISLFKKIVTGNTIKAEEKGKDPVSFVPFSTLVFSANNIPKMNDPTGAGLRRLLIVPMRAKFSKQDKDYNPNIRRELDKAECVEYFIQCALDGLADVLEHKSYTTPKASREATDEYEKDNNPILAFIEELEDLEVEVLNETTDDVFMRFMRFCSSNGYRFDSITKKTFVRDFSKLANMKSSPRIRDIAGVKKNVRVFVWDKK